MNTFLNSLRKSDFLHFIKNPNQKFNGVLKLDISLFVLTLILSFFAAYVKSLITSESFIDDSDIDKFNYSKIFPFIFLIPLIEELVFRGFLQFKSQLVFILSLISTLFCVTSIIKSETAVTYIIVAIIFFGLLVFFNKKIYKKMLRFIEVNALIIIYVSSILFGSMHFLNYDTFSWVNLIPIFEKIIAGVFLCYITKKYNIWLSYVFHIINNSVPFFIIMLYQLHQ